MQKAIHQAITFVLAGALLILNIDGAQAQQCINLIDQSDATICGTSVDLSVSNPNSTADNRFWTAQGPAGTTVNYSPDSTNTSITATVSDTGTFVFYYVEEDVNCIDSVTIHFNHAPSADAGNTQSVCDTIFQLDGTTIHGTGSWTYFDNDGSGGIVRFNPNENVEDPIVSSQDLGVYGFVYTVENDECPADRDTVFNRFAEPFEEEIDAGDDTVVCGDQELQLDASRHQSTTRLYTREWSFFAEESGTISFEDENGNSANSNPQAIAKPSKQGVYFIIWNVEERNACEESDTIRVAFYDEAIANAGSDAEVCGEEHQLNDASAEPAEANVSWRTITSPAGGQVTYTPADAVNPTLTINGVYGTYVIEQTVQIEECVDTDTVEITFNEQPEADAGQSAEECGDTGRLAATPSNGSGMWRQKDGPGTTEFTPSDTIPNPFTEVTELGTYTYVWTETNENCADSAEVEVTYFDTANTNAGEDDSICASETSFSYTLQGSYDYGTGTWSLVNGPGTATFNDPNQAVTDVTVSDTGVYTFALDVIADDCEETDTVIITFNQKPDPDAGENDTVCELSTQLNATPSIGEGYWTSRTSTEGAVTYQPDSLQPDATVTVTEYGQYTFVWHEREGACEDSAEVIVEFVEQPEANAGDGDTVCADTFFTNATPSRGEGSWRHLEQTGTLTFEDPSNPNTKVTVTEEGLYTLIWREDTLTCFDEDTIAVRFFFEPTIDAGEDQTVCDSIITVNGITDFGSGRWFSNNNNEIRFTDSLAANTDARALTYDTYELYWEVSNGVCPVKTDTLVATFNEFPTVDAGDDASVCADTHTLTAVSSVGDGWWTWTSSTNNNLVFETDSTQDTARIRVVDLDIEAIFELTWHERNDTCEDSATVQISFYEEVVVMAGNNDSVCDSTYAFDAQITPQFDSLRWRANGPGPVTFSDVTIANPTVQIDTDNYGVYEFILDAYHVDCEGSDTVLISFFETPNPNAGLDDSACDRQYDLAAIPSFGDGMWTFFTEDGRGNPVFDDPTDPNTSVTSDISNRFHFIWTETNGACEASDTVEIILAQQPEARIFTEPDSICGFDDQLIAFQGNGVGTWSFSELSNTGIIPEFNPSANQSNINVFVTDESSFDFIWTESDSGCTDSDSVEIWFFDSVRIEVQFPTSEFICDSSTNLGVSLSSGVGMWSFTTTTNGGEAEFFTPNDTQTSVVIDTYGFYTFFFEASNGVCPDSRDSIPLEFYEKPLADAGTGDTICGDTFITNAIAANVGTGMWSHDGPIGAIIFEDATNPVTKVTALQEGVYRLTWTVTHEQCEEQDAVTVQFFNQPTAFAGPDTSACDNTVQLNGKITPSIADVEWTSIPGDANFIVGNTDTNSVVRVPSPIDSVVVYNFALKVSIEGCEAFDTVEYAFFEPVIPNAGSDIDVCDDSTKLNATRSVGRGWWTYSTPSGGVLTFVPDSLVPNPSILASEFGDYALTWHEQNGACEDSAVINVSFSEQPIANAGNGDTLCANDYQLNGVASVGEGMWSAEGPGTGGFDPLNSATALFGPSEQGNYQLIWTEDNNGCIDSDTIQVQLDFVPSADAGLDREFCGLEGVLSGTRFNGSAKWELLSGAPGTVNYDPTDTVENPAVEVSAFGFYSFSFTVKNGICPDAIDTVNIIFTEQPVADAGIGDTVCGDTIELFANPSLGAGEWRELSNSGNVEFESAIAPNTKAIALIEGSYQLVWTETNRNLCVDSDTIDVQFFEKPIIDAGDDDTACADNYTLSGVTSIADSGIWSVVGSGNVVFDDVRNPNSVVTDADFGVDTLVWTVTNGLCLERDTVVISFFEQPEAMAGRDTAMCDSITELYAVRSIGDGAWTYNGPGVLAFTPDSLTDTVQISTADYGVYDLIWTEDNNGCIDRDTAVVNFTQQPIAFAGNDTIACVDSFVLTAIPSALGSTGFWQVDSGQLITFSPDSLQHDAVVYFTADSTFEFIWTEVNGTCIDSDTLIATLHTPPTVNFNGTNFEICDTIIEEIIAQKSHGTGYWSADSAENAHLTFTPDTLSDTISLSTDSFGLYEVHYIVNYASCEADTNRITVRFDEQTIANADGDYEFCGDTGVVTAILSIDSASGFWTSLDTGLTFDDSTQISTLVRGDTFGIYRAIWTEVNGTCGDADTVTISFFDTPTISVVEGDSICGFEGEVVGTKNFGEGLWGDAGSTQFDYEDATADSTTFAIDRYGFGEALWTVTNGACVVTDTVFFHFTENPVADAGDDAILCDSFIYQLEGFDSPFERQWDVIFGDTNLVFSDSSDPEAIITSAGYDHYVLTWTLRNFQCVVVDTVSIIMAETPQADINEFKFDTFCGFNSELIALPSVGIGTWREINGLPVDFAPNANDDTVTATVFTEGNYVFEWQEVNRGVCIDADTVSVYYYEIPIADAGPDQQVCDFTTNLEGTINAGTGYWIYESDSLLTFADSTDPTTQITAAEADSVRYELFWIVQNGICANDTDTVIIDFYRNPVADAGFGDTVCGDSVQLMANPSVGIGTWSVVGNGGIQFIPSANDAAVTARLTNSVYGVYQFVWTETNGVCVSADTVTVRFDELPIIDAGPDDTLSCDLTLQLQGQTTVGFGSWQTLNPPTGVTYAPDSLRGNPLVTADEYQSYQLEWLVENGVCLVRDTLDIDFREQPVANIAQNDTAVCDDELQLMTSSSVGSGAWLVNGSNPLFFTPDSLQPNVTIEAPEYGRFELIWTLNNDGCEDFDTIQVDFFEQPVADISVIDSSCSLFTKIVATQNAGSGQWQFNALGSNEVLSISPSDTLPNGIISASVRATFEVIWTLQNGICTDTAVDTVAFVAQRQAMVMADSVEVCGLTGNLIATLSEGTWRVLSGPGSLEISDSTDPFTAIVSDTFGTYQLEWLVEDTICGATIDTQTLVLYAEPSVEGLTDTIFCGLSGLLNFNLEEGDITFNIDPQAFTFITDDIVEFRTQSTTTDSLTVVYTLTNGVCAVIDSFKVGFNNDEVFADGGEDQDICGLETVVFAGTPIGFWSTNDDILIAPDINSPIIGVEALSLGEKLLFRTSGTGLCQVIDTVVLNFKSQPTADAGMDDLNCNTSYTLQGNTLSGTEEGIWSYLGDDPIIFEPDNQLEQAEISAPFSGEYTLVWNVEDDGCLDADTVVVNLSPPVFERITDSTAATFNGVVTEQYLIGDNWINIVVEDRLLMQVNPYGQDLGLCAIGVRTLPFAENDYRTLPVMSRSWFIETLDGRRLREEIGVRLFITPDEVRWMQAVDPTIRDINDIALTHYRHIDSTDADLSRCNDAWFIDGGQYSPIEPDTLDYCNGIGMEFNITEYGAFYGNRRGTLVTPPQLTDIDIEEREDKYLHFSFSFDLDANYNGYVVQRSRDGENYEDLDTFTPNQTNEFFYDDYDVEFTRLYYYRVKAISDICGDKFSNFRTGVVGFHFYVADLFPNPANTVVNIRLFGEIEQNASAVIFDELGNVVETQFLRIELGANDFQMQVGHLQDDHYFIRFRDFKGHEVWKKLIVKHGSR